MSRAPDPQRERLPREAQPSSGQLSHADRHEINLRYHLMRDHLDEMRLSGCLLCLPAGSHWQLLDDGAAPADGDGQDGRRSNVRSVKDADASEDVAAAAAAAVAADHDDSDSGGTRFKHQRRSSRWNQEFDEEVREMLGFVDRGYYPTKVYRVK